MKRHLPSDTEHALNRKTQHLSDIYFYRQTEKHEEEKKTSVSCKLYSPSCHLTAAKHRRVSILTGWVMHSSWWVNWTFCVKLVKCTLKCMTNGPVLIMTCALTIFGEIFRQSESWGNQFKGQIKLGHIFLCERVRGGESKLASFQSVIHFCLIRRFQERLLHLFIRSHIQARNSCGASLRGFLTWNRTVGVNK